MDRLALAGWFVLANLLDLATTLYAVETYGSSVEANPFVGVFIATFGPAGLLLHKALFGGIMLLLLAKVRTKPMYYLIYFSMLLTMGAAFLNLLQLAVQ